ANEWFSVKRENTMFVPGIGHENAFRRHIRTARDAAINLKKYQHVLEELRGLRVQISKSVVSGEAQAAVFKCEQKAREPVSEYRIDELDYTHARNVLGSYVGIRKLENKGIERLDEDIRKRQIIKGVLESE
ncbi:MAG: hypothetical protein V3V26_01640, partial [Candidatus Aenigmarchaeota archaeon]